MAKKDNKIITYEKINNLIFYTDNLLKKYPKCERFNLCTDIKNLIYECLRNVIYAWKEFENEKKLTYLKKVDVDLVVLKTFILISYKYKYITQKNFMVWTEQVTEIGKLIGGWIKSCQKV